MALNIKNALKSNIKVKDVAIGVATGLAGVVAAGYAKAALASFIPPGIVATVVDKVAPLVGATAAGLALYNFGTKKSAHLVGAVTTGVAFSAWEALKGSIPAFADVVELNLNGYRGYRGLLTNDPRMNGLMVEDQRGSLNAYNDNPNLAGLAAATMAMGDDVDEFDM